MSVYEIAEKFKDKSRKIPYPQIPVKPDRDVFSSNEAYGKALDNWEFAIEIYNQEQRAYKQRQQEIKLEFKNALGRELGLSKHPKYDTLYNMAWERGHSSGYTEVAMEAENLSELLK